MTLLLSCLTPKYIVHVSDRRLTWPNGDLADETANKAIVFAPNALFSYTGIARVGNLRTDEWIAEQLIGRTGIQDAITHLTNSLNTTIRTLPYANRQLAVVVDCWATTSEQTLNKPFSCAITNFYDRQERKIVDRPFNTFNTFTQTLPDGKGYAFLPMGQNVPSDILKELHRNIVRAMRHVSPTPTTISPNTVGRFMVHAVRCVARRNIRVGSNLMLTILPNRQTADYANESNKFAFYGNDSDPTYYAPTLITPTMAIKGFKMYPGPPRFAIKGNDGLGG